LSRSEKNAAAFAEEESMSAKIARSVRMPYFIPLIITFVMSFGLVAYESVIGLYLDNQFSASAKDISYMLMATGAVSVLAQLFAVDRLVQRYGEARVLITFLGVASFGFTLSLFASSYMMFFAISLLIYLSMAILRPVLNVMISKMADGEVGFAMGMSTSYMSIGNVIGPLSAGILYDINIVFPFILGLSLLMITGMITAAWYKSAKTAPKTEEKPLALEAGPLA
jgi:MFS transporter, DHA1 family, multidrug resistance protein